MNVNLNRRAVLMSVAMSALTSIVRATASPAIKAVAFDAFAIFDARPIYEMCENLFPRRGAELAQAWRTRQFEYQWLRALAGRYVNFWDATRDALVFAASSQHVEMTVEQRDKLMDGYLQLRAWPDVKPALETLRSLGLKLAVLSNATPQILRRGIANSGLQGAFDGLVSTDVIQSYKPDSRAYQLGMHTLGLRKEEILFVAFAGWDVAGAKWFGYPTFWNNRTAAAEEQLGVTPNASGATLNELVEYVRNTLHS
jgi:2-haloacid dehalogenase